MGEEKKRCYRYVDFHDSSGNVVIEIWEHVVLFETEFTFQHVYDMPGLTIEQMSKMFSKSRKKLSRCYKNASRSAWHLTREEAYKAFLYRKQFQLSRMRLAVERVQLALEALEERGHAVRHHDLGTLYPADRPAPGRVTATTTPGPVASEFNWGDW